jgi:phosphatidate cytidylyltransferase
MSAAAPRSLSNLQLRILSAIVLAALALGATWLGGATFQILMAIMALAIFYEWSVMARKPGNAVLQTVAGGLLVCMLLALLFGLPAELIILGLAASVALVYAFGLARGGGGETAVSLAYAGAAVLALALLRGADSAGLLAILYLFAVVWATDVMAYFVGRAVGGPKLAPSISPGKTWSGAIGGAAGGFIAGLIVVLAAGQGSALRAGLIALLLSIVSQVGDLFESSVKRRHGAKDSGHLIPGHGGVLDRVDGLVAAAIALYLIGAASGGLETPASNLLGQ